MPGRSAPPGRSPGRAAPTANAPAGAGTARSAAARRRLQRWRDLPPFCPDSSAHGAHADRWRRRLAADGLDEESMLALLAETPGALARRARRAAPPVRLDWLQDLAAAYRQPPPAPEELPAGEPAAGTLPGPHAALLEPLAPLLRQARRRLEDRLRRPVAAAPGLLPSARETADLLLPHLVARLRALVARTVVLELHVAGLEGTLDGATPEARFQCFRDRLRQPAAALALLRRYPVLARQAARRAELWVSAGGELVDRLAADRRRLRAAFSPDRDPGRLLEVVAGAGDPHRGGRTVTLLRFASGLRLVYKPKPLAVEAAFQEVLRWLNGRGLAVPLRPLRLLDRGGYGWVEHVAQAPCAEAAEVERFYRRLGAQLAVLYALDASDMHSENLIAAGEHPMLIDLETLFHPAPDDLAPAPAASAAAADGAAAGAPPAAADGAVAPPAWRSVLRVGLLPERIWGHDGQAGIDVSGLGGEPGQMTPRPVLQLLDPGTDRMRFTRRQVELPAAANQPRLADAEIHPHHHADAIAGGFAGAYRLLLAGRGELLAPGGPLAAFAGAEVRVILRATQGYGALLGESFHPDVLGDALRRDQLFDRLWNGPFEGPRLAALVAAERQDLERGDVPLFTSLPESRDLWTGAGERLPGCFAASGLERVRGHLERLDEADLVVQEWTLRGTLAALALTAGAFRHAPHRVPAGAPPAGREALLAAARTTGDRLAALASRDGDHAYWLGLGPTADGRWVFGPLQADLYGGLPGIALFLAHLGAAAGEPRFTGLARAALASLRPLLRGERAPLPLLGAFGGWGGLIYTLVHLGLLWRDPGLFSAAAGCVERMAPQIAADDHCDLLDGAAGGLAGLLALHRVLPGSAVLDAARACGDRLLARAEAQPAGIGWRVPAGPGALTGFSHGTAGIGWALLGLATVTGERRYRDGARGALRFERALYAPERRAWPDLRDEERQQSWAAEEERAATAAAAARTLEAAQAARADDVARAAAATRAAGEAAAAAAAARVARGGGARLCAWCHGATGIGFSRLGMLDLLGVDAAGRRRGGSSATGARSATAARLVEEIGIAVENTLAEGFGRDHSLCHGDLGSLDFLLTAARRLGDPKLLDRTYRLAAGVLESIAEGGWRFGVAAGAEPPGLMVGLAGIGYGLLRLHDPEQVPSVLLLDLPRAAASR
ncbi:MAG TPA: type 2 lanthipeptide synthetase LanM family protein [Thermoanaerobaculia bacterium]|nr:type 2 lanthipeptide synthetase LanM family protein [Thermoanaerobaculia bacterium]